MTRPRPSQHLKGAPGISSMAASYKALWSPNAATLSSKLVLSVISLGHSRVTDLLRKMVTARGTLEPRGSATPGKKTQKGKKSWNHLRGGFKDLKGISLEPQLIFVTQNQVASEPHLAMKFLGQRISITQLQAPANLRTDSDLPTSKHLKHWDHNCPLQPVFTFLSPLPNTLLCPFSGREVGK